MARIRTTVLKLIVLSFTFLSGTALQSQDKDEMRGAVISFERFGGFAGISTRFWIYPDGRVVDDIGTAQTIPAKTVDSLLRRIHAIKMPTAVSKSLCSDCYQYRISISGKSGLLSYVVEEPFLNHPGEKCKVVKELGDLLFR